MLQQKQQRPQHQVTPNSSQSLLLSRDPVKRDAQPIMPSQFPSAGSSGEGPPEAAENKPEMPSEMSLVRTALYKFLDYPRTHSAGVMTAED